MKFSEVPLQDLFFDGQSGENWRKISDTQAVCQGGGDALEGGTDTFSADDEVELVERENKYRNYYEHCNQQWQDHWSCMCNDRCPVCNAEIEPYKSEELDEQGQVVDVIQHVCEIKP